jgi:hypothetical protein
MNSSDSENPRCDPLLAMRSRFGFVPIQYPDRWRELGVVLLSVEIWWPLVLGIDSRQIIPFVSYSPWSWRACSGQRSSWHREVSSSLSWLSSLTHTPKHEPRVHPSSSLRTRAPKNLRTTHFADHKNGPPPHSSVRAFPLSRFVEKMLFKVSGQRKTHSGHSAS